MPDVYFIKELDQIKALSEPLRVRILESLTHHEMTTKQVADSLGEPPTKLYRHVEQLREVGLLKLVRTNSVNGITEKYYRAVAEKIRVDRNLFSPGPQAEVMETMSSALVQFLESMLDEVREAMRLKTVSEDDHSINLHQRSVVAKKEEVAELADQMTSLIESFEPSKTTGEKARYRITALSYPVQDEEFTESADDNEQEKGDD